MNGIGESYSKFLQNYDWDYFATVTFRKPRRDPIYNLQQVWGMVDCTAQWGYNINRGFFISEPHTIGFLHYHCLLHEARISIDGGGVYNAGDYQRAFSKRFGFSNVSAIKNMNEVSAYCCKYVLKAMDSPLVDYQFLGDWTT